VHTFEPPVCYGITPNAHLGRSKNYDAPYRSHTQRNKKACHTLLARSGIELGSGTPKSETVGQITMAQVAEIARIKLPDTNATKVSKEGLNTAVK